jgi:Tfp pilus assembly protein PilN
VRPVNLIPPEQRRDRGVSRTGALAYIVVGALIALLAGVVLIVLSSNQISESEAELTTLNAQQAAAEARADRLSPYAGFQQVARQRTTTVLELADSRFDWPRVLRQLSLVVPKYVVLGRLVGLAGQGVGDEGGEGEGSSLAGEIKGPSLTLEGCALNQKRVAALIVALDQIDGVTRVGLGSAKRASEDSGGEEGACDAVDFNIAVAFDAAPVSPNAADGEAAAAPVAEEPSSEADSAATSGAESTTKTEADGSETTVSETTTVTPPN